MQNDNHSRYYHEELERLKQGYRKLRDAHYEADINWHDDIKTKFCDKYFNNFNDKCSSYFRQLESILDLIEKIRIDIQDMQ